MANFATWSFGEGESKKEVVFHVGDVVRVHYKLIEKEKVTGKAKKEVKEELRERIQVFEGIVIAIKGAAENTMFMVRKIGVGNIGVERIFPLVSPWIKKMEIKKRGTTRRSKLYYLRTKTGKAAMKVGEFHESQAPAAR